MILVVNTNSNDCKIYHYDRHPAQLTLLRQISHPDNKLRNVDLVTDKEGHYGRGAYSPHAEPKEVEISNFSREIAEDLNQRRNANGFEKLILIASPHMYGLISQHLNKHVSNLISNHIQKDLVYMKEHELLDFLKKNTKFSD